MGARTFNDNKNYETRYEPSITEGIGAGGVTKDPDGQRWFLQLRDGNLTWIKVPDANTGHVIDIPWSQASGDDGGKNWNLSKAGAGPLNNNVPDSSTLRWPKDAISETTDYVFFQFGRYKPPFSRDVDKLRKAAKFEEDNVKQWQSKKFGKDLVKNTNTINTYDMYNASNMLEEDTGLGNIMLPVPQDLSNEIQQQWQGKQFTATGRAATAALAAGNFSYASEVVKNIAGNAIALQTALNTTVLNSIPGVGGNIEFNDVSGSSRGIVINPNAELLYDSPEMREIGMIFKMVPQNDAEAKTIQNIVKAFRKASMPSWGGDSGEDLLKGQASTQVDGGKKEEEKKSRINLGDKNNWIQIPHLCKFTFMKGGTRNPYLIQFKPCAISAVEVNYTPDGTYNTYWDGSPVATELRLNFMETKLIFSDEVDNGF